MSAAENEPAKGGPEALVEAEDDLLPTRMAYAPGGYMPWLVTGLWIVAMLALIAYWAVYAIPDVARWGAP